MAICSRCNCEYDEDDLNLFGGADIDRIPEEMCLSCLESAYDSCEEGLFYDTCEECGKDFDVMVEKSLYESMTNDDGVGYGGWGRILCAECSIDELNDCLDDPEGYSSGW